MIDATRLAHLRAIFERRCSKALTSPPVADWELGFNRELAQALAELQNYRNTFGETDAPA